MHDIALDLVVLLAGIWLVAVTLRPLGLPTVMGELIVGVLLGPAVLGVITPSEAIQLLAEIGIFFLMFHAGVETQPLEFYDALKRSLGVAIVGAIVPFGVSFGIATLFGLDPVGATFVGLTMTATAVVITLKSLKDLGLANTRVARIIIASCVIDDLLTLIFFGLVIGVLSGGTFDPFNIVIALGKVVVFFGAVLLLGRFVYPRLKLPFRSEGGKGFTFVLMTALAAGLFAEAIGLHMILGAYMAGLFFEDKVAHPNLVRIVNDRAYGIAYSFLGPIFFISLGFSITFDISASDVAFIVLLTSVLIVGQISSAGVMALQMGLPFREALTVGVGMCGRAEMAFILASLALAQGAIGQENFTALVFTCFVLNLFTPLALKGCAALLEGKAVWQADATEGVVQIDKFADPLVDVRPGEGLSSVLPDVVDAIVIYGYGSEVDSLMEELGSRNLPVVVIEEHEPVAMRLHTRGVRVVHTALSEGHLDLQPLARARALVVNGEDENNALLTMQVREHGFSGPIVALVDNPHRRAPLHLIGVTAAFTPTHVLAAAVAGRASLKIDPRIAGVEPLRDMLGVSEIRVHDESPLANKTLAELGLRAETGALIVGQWLAEELRSPPAPDQVLQSGTILVAVGSPDSLSRLGEVVRPITQEGTIVVAGSGNVGRKVVEMLKAVGETVCVIEETEHPDVDVVGDVLDTAVLSQAGVTTARVVILACENDNATLLASTVVRNYAPDVPVIACVEQMENVGRIQQAGTDFALSISQVAGQFLAYHVLGELVTQQARIKLIKFNARPLAGSHPLKAQIRERSGCSVVAVERGGEIVMDIPPSFVLEGSDALYICGTTRAFERFYEAFAESRAV